MCCDDSCSDTCRVVFCNITPFKNAAKDSLPCPDNTNKFILFWVKLIIQKKLSLLGIAIQEISSEVLLIRLTPRRRVNLLDLVSYVMPLQSSGRKLY